MTVPTVPPAHPSKKLGRRPPSNKRALALGSYLTGLVPTHPTEADHLVKVSDWGLYGNDVFGVCGPTCAANSRKLVTRDLGAAEVSPSQDAVFDLYRRSGNPDFDPNLSEGDPRQDDNGVDMQTMLEAMVAGGLGGVKPLGFAKVDVTSNAELHAAIAIFGFLLLGVTLHTAQQNQDTWDYVTSPTWGGHAVLNGRYKEAAGRDRSGVISWAEVHDMTDSFVQHQLDEAWVVIWPEHLIDSAFLAGVNLVAFAADYKAITGREFPVPLPAPSPIPVPPVPDPEPVPTPGPPVPDPVPPGPPPFGWWSTMLRWWRTFVTWLRGIV